MKLSSPQFSPIILLPLLILLKEKLGLMIQGKPSDNVPIVKEL